ncbi:MAG: YaeQ family protein [Kangiellaceae bacterium]
MAIKPTIYKFNISLSDINREIYNTLNLTLAQHPSETAERMTTRLLAFCINYEEKLTFTKGLSEVEEPDIWCVEYNDDISLWIDVGEPDVERIKKASRKSNNVKVYSFNSKSDVWWQQSQDQFKILNASFYRFDWDSIKTLSSLLDRTMNLSVMLTGDSAYVTYGDKSCEINWERLFEESYK